MRFLGLQMATVLTAVCLSSTLWAANEPKPEKFFFPDTASGDKVLAADFHIHTVFSDGWVWPTVRVDEARREGLAAIAMTDHVEFFRHAQYLVKMKNGLVDLNTSYAIASGYAKEKALIYGAYATGNVEVIHAVEITRGFGHFNCIYTTDNNKLRVDGLGDDQFRKYMETDEQAYRNTVQSLTTANEQGAFCLWNHPSGPGQGRSDRIVLEPIHRELIASRKVKGIEVASYATIYYDAIDIALQNNLTIFGDSDTHQPIGIDLVMADVPHRNVTLVIAHDTSEASIKKALEDRKTLALYRETLIGSTENIATVLQSALRVTLLQSRHGSNGPETVPLEFENRSCLPITVELDKALKPVNQTAVLTIPAYSKQRVSLFVEPTPSTGVRVRVVNSVTRGGVNAEVVLPLESGGPSVQ